MWATLTKRHRLPYMRALAFALILREPRDDTACAFDITVWVITRQIHPLTKISEINPPIGEISKNKITAIITQIGEIINNKKAIRIKQMAPVINIC